MGTVELAVPLLVPGTLVNVNGADRLDVKALAVPEWLFSGVAWLDIGIFGVKVVGPGGGGGGGGSGDEVEGVVVVGAVSDCCCGAALAVPDGPTDGVDVAIVPDANGDIGADDGRDGWALLLGPEGRVA